MEAEIRTHFLANACHVCKSKATPVACEVCRMIFYCSPEHRRSDWFDHSQICWAVSKICESGRRGCLWELREGKDFTEFRHEIVARCTELLKRRLKPWEIEMIYHPRMCGVCREFAWTSLSRCKDCEFVYACEKAHFRQDHRKWCKTMKLYSDFIICQSLGNGLKPFRLEIKSEIFKSMSEVLEKNCKGKDVGKNVEIQKALTSELLTYPLTVAEGLKAIGAPRGQSLGVLFVGAETQAEVEPLEKWEKYFLHRFDGVRSMTLTFLGPELRGPDRQVLGDLCETCRKEEKVLKFEFVEGKFFHEYCKLDHEEPVLVCALNSGMYRDFGFGNENSWEETIRKLFTRGKPPVLITEYTRRELKMVIGRVRKLCGDVEEILPPQMNPFASLKPGLNILSEDETPVIFKNYYYTLLQKK